MGAVWLHDLPEILEPTGLDVLWWPGWETRSRSSGGYDKILAVQAHHDASGKSWTLEQGMARACAPDNPDRPVGALWLGRDARVGVLAAGATNTSGRGWALQCSNGVIPTDAANRYVIAIEAMNNGVGEVWPADQLEAYRVLCAALIDAYDLDPGAHWADLHAHYEYTDRKIDPAGPPYAKAGDRWLRWDMDRFRADVAAEREDDDVFIDNDIPPRILSTRPLPEDPSALVRVAPIPAGGGVIEVPIPFSGDIDKVRCVVTVVPIAPNGFFRVSRGSLNPADPSFVHSNGNWSNGSVENSTVEIPIDNGRFKVYANTATHVLVDWLAYRKRR